MIETQGCYNYEFLADFNGVQDVKNGYAQTWQRFRIFLLPSEISDKLFQYPYISKARYNMLKPFFVENFVKTVRLTSGKIPCLL